MLKIYAIPGACSLAPSIALRELRVPFDSILVDPTTKQCSDGEDYWQVNPLGYVPSLRLEDGRLLTETSTILDYLSERHGGLPKAGKGRCSGSG